MRTINPLPDAVGREFNPPATMGAVIRKVSCFSHNFLLVLRVTFLPPFPQSGFVLVLVFFHSIGFSAFSKFILVFVRSVLSLFFD